jgi:hypothetical protein
VRCKNIFFLNTKIRKKFAYCRTKEGIYLSLQHSLQQHPPFRGFANDQNSLMLIRKEVCRKLAKRGYAFYKQPLVTFNVLIFAKIFFKRSMGDDISPRKMLAEPKMLQSKEKEKKIRHQQGNNTYKEKQPQQHTQLQG